MNVEREYYENDTFWRDDALGERESARVEALLGQIPDPVSTIVELGCGNGIFVNSLANQTREFDMVVAIDRSVSALRYVKVPKICASIDQLPLPDSMFDCVAALEVLEHLPAGIYNVALAELCRMSRKFALVSVPYRQNLKEGLVECPSCAARFNPDYHVRSFDERTLSSLLTPFGFRCQRQVKIGAFMRYRGIASFRALTGTTSVSPNPFDTGIPCPSCGVYLPAGQPQAAVANAPGSNGSGVKSMIKKYWPQEQSHIWIAALYERVA